MSDRDIASEMGELEALSSKMISQLKQIEVVVITNRRDRQLILNSPLPVAEKEKLIMKLDHQALRIKKTAHTLLSDLEHSLSLETILKYI